MKKELDNTFNEKQSALTNQMQKIDEAVERANLVSTIIRYGLCFFFMINVIF